MDINSWLAAHRIDPATLNSQPVVDIGGIQLEFESIAQRFEHPELVAAAGASLPRGVLLMGTAGVGKTTWARWLAKRLAGMDLYEIGPEELTADRIRDGFAVLRDRRSILFIEDVDHFGLERSRFGATDRSGGVTKALLSAMDGIVDSPWPLVIGATTYRDRVRIDARRSSLCSPVEGSLRRSWPRLRVSLPRPSATGFRRWSQAGR